MTDDNESTLHRLTTGGFARRLELSRLGLRYGSRAVGQSLRERFSHDEAAALARRRENIRFFIEELGRLKGSVVKIGQLMATYGDYLLPPEVAEALHSLEDNTPPMSWAAIRGALQKELDSYRLAELDIDRQPLAAASLGQVHRARVEVSGEELCVKVQYPGVDRTIDADFQAVMALMRISRLLESTRNIDDWFGDIRQLLHKEVDYQQERRDLDFVAGKLCEDSRYIVPRSSARYSTMRVLTMSYEPSLAVAAPEVLALSQARRNALGEAVLHLFLLELFSWQRMQTDPNFGNYRVRIDPRGRRDQLVLLDFGAMRLLPSQFAGQFCEMMVAAYRQDREAFLRCSIGLGFMKAHFPEEVLESFVDIGLDIAEPLRKPSQQLPAEALSADGLRYDWRNSNLPKRVAKKAVAASMSKYFALPPKDFLYVMRKLMGVYALIAHFGAVFDGEAVFAPFVDSWASDKDTDIQR
ncbi:AarF/ABC1/UbiB kinase family protein [Spongiibacter sp. KMU-166]|uniref:AarF/ABC1/UbiB kinase family protein n=1 Tax=Spongiibacter thalassae TaxID=2721624 RepID=A0ABX1GFT9_9GAMM|nr:AarF/ABC1/UbiB kinase family protein [Spongiibacter thalassae]NKI18064.1 AarF/ABC1/UbiB kinase family protein [Spongiibacter thalassae]